MQADALSFMTRLLPGEVLGELNLRQFFARTR